MELRVSGLRCPDCMLRAGSGTLALDGVESVEVLLDERLMRVRVLPGRIVPLEALLEALRRQGFGAEPRRPEDVLGNGD